MPELPEYMLQKDRQPDPVFSPSELLFRRVPKDTWGERDMWEDEDIALDCIEFPDMSVSREKYGPSQAVRWERGRLVDWGVIGFQVESIPAVIPFQGAVKYKMRPIHKPEKRNYPHTEVQVFESPWDQPGVELHIGAGEMPGIPLDAQQEWREMLRRECRIILRPGDDAEAS
jgi:hypothetical protein